MYNEFTYVKSQLFDLL